jgi:hypothetical protein
MLTAGVDVGSSSVKSVVMVPEVLDRMSELFELSRLMIGFARLCGDGGCFIHEGTNTFQLALGRQANRSSTSFALAAFQPRRQTPAKQAQSTSYGKTVSQASAYRTCRPERFGGGRRNSFCSQLR